VGLRVRADELRRHAFLFGQHASRIDHLLRNVDTDAVALRTTQSCNSARRTAGAATDIEHVPRATGGNRCDEYIFERLQYPIEQRLRLDPRATGRTVPKLRLLVARSLYCLHARLLSLVFQIRCLHSATSSRLEVKR
jgi:hypothetical protein